MCNFCVNIILFGAYNRTILHTISFYFVSLHQIIIIFRVMAKKSTPIPGLSFSLKRALGITQAKQKLARETGIPTSKAGIERKIGNILLKSLFGKK